jgi:hypothetical protein
MLVFSPVDEESIHSSCNTKLLAAQYNHLSEGDGCRENTVAALIIEPLGSTVCGDIGQTIRRYNHGILDRIFKGITTVHWTDYSKV